MTDNLEGGPLPPGWDVGRDFDGKIYFIDHNSQRTTWIDPRYDRLTSSAAKTSEASATSTRAPNVHYFVATRPPTESSSGEGLSEWRQMQEEMLRQYLATAESDLRAKQELFDVKQQRYQLAKDEYQNLNRTFLASLSASSTSSLASSSSSSVPSPSLSTSTNRSVSSANVSPRPKLTHCSPRCNSYYSHSSLSSTGSATSKYDPDLLRSDVQHARARVDRLQRELAHIDTEMAYKQRGMDALAEVSAKYSNTDRLSSEEAEAIRNEVANIQRSLLCGEQEKMELVRTLSALKEDLSRVQPQQGLEKPSTACQTDLLDEWQMLSVGARLAEMAKLRLEYDEARRKVQSIQQRLSQLEEALSPGQVESDKDRLLLTQDKEQLARELRANLQKSRSRDECLEIREKIASLERDLKMAMERSNRCIADRLRLHEEKQLLLHQLKDGMRLLSRLELQLRRVKSTSCQSLSVSSSSSLGSLSSSHASSKASLSSLSFTDIYGLSTVSAADAHDPFALDLQRMLNANTYANVNCDPEPTTEAEDTSSALLSTQQQSLSPRSSLSASSSSSPPVSPQVEPTKLELRPTGLATIAENKNGSDADSGVYEVGLVEELRSLRLETAAQLQLRINFDKESKKLGVHVERARHLAVLFIPDNHHIYVKGTLGSEEALCTQAIAPFQRKPVFSENFVVQLESLENSVMQITVWASNPDSSEQTDECLGCAQLDLEKLELGVLQWHNVLSFRFLRPHRTSERDGTLTNESSGESTINSSKTSTLTRNEDNNNNDMKTPLEDKETNTEPLLYATETNNNKSNRGGLGGVRLKKSRPHSLKPDEYDSNYVCKLNRSDSDSAMSVHRKRVSFQRSMLERRSLRIPHGGHAVGSAAAAANGNFARVANPAAPAAPRRPRGSKLVTPIDLDLDLAAQKTKLRVLQDEIERLKELKRRLEACKTNQGGLQRLPNAVHETFQQVVANNDASSAEDRRADRLVQKTGKDLYRLRRTRAKGQPDVQSFKEKMAFFTSIKPKVPAIVQEEHDNSNCSTLKANKDEESKDYVVDPDVGVIV